MHVIKTVMSPSSNRAVQFLEYKNKKFRLSYNGNIYKKSFKKDEATGATTYNFKFSKELVKGSVLKDDKWHELIQDGDVYYPKDTILTVATASEALEARSKSIFEAMQEHVEMLYCI